MITTTRNITDGKIALVERIPLPDDDNHPTQIDGLGDDFMQFACKIAEKNTKHRNKVISEPVFKQFNAPSRKAAFEYADAHIEEWVKELKDEVSKPKILQANANAMTNRLRLNGHS